MKTTHKQGVQTCYFLRRSQADFASKNARADYEQYLEDIEIGIEQEGIKCGGLIEFVESSALLPLIAGEANALDLIIIEDDADIAASILDQVDSNQSFQRVLIVDSPYTMQWLVTHDNIIAPKIITLDLQLIIKGDIFGVTTTLYNSIKAKWQNTCVIGLSNNEQVETAQPVIEIIRSTGESVWLKNVFLKHLAHILRDRLSMHSLRKENVALKQEVTTLKEALGSAREFQLAEVMAITDTKELDNVKFWLSNQEKALSIISIAKKSKKILAQAMLLLDSGLAEAESALREKKHQIKEALAKAEDDIGADKNKKELIKEAKRLINAARPDNTMIERFKLGIKISTDEQNKDIMIYKQNALYTMRVLQIWATDYPLTLEYARLSKNDKDFQTFVDRIVREFKL